MRGRTWVGSLLLLIMWSAPAIADDEAGMRAYKKGDYATALKEWRPLAEQGDADAQLNLGFMYNKGEGIPQNSSEAARLYRLAAEQGNTLAQFSLGWMYDLGNGVPQDYVQAYMWYNLAAATGDKPSAVLRNIVAKKMTPEQIARAQELARAWRPATISDTPPTPSLPGQSKGTELAGSATGFIVSGQGHVMTNYHVVEGCSTLIAKTSVGSRKLNLLARDTNNDFALLGFLKPVSSVLAFSGNLRVKLGQSIYAAGFPLQGLLASSLNLTTGNISALAGILYCKYP